MELNAYLRVIVNNTVRPLFIKSQCDSCGNNNDLHLHHIKLFSDIVNETLERLNLTYQDTNDYKDNDLQNIIDIVLGTHLQVKFLTLCDQCHKLTHKDNWKHITVNSKHEEYYYLQKKEKNIKREIYDKEVLLPFLINNKDKIYLSVWDRVQIIDKININQNGRQIRNIHKLNEYISKLGFCITRFQTSRIIEGKKENFKAAWRIDTL
jgi:hypothetical protein